MYGEFFAQFELYDSESDFTNEIFQSLFVYIHGRECGAAHGVNALSETPLQN